MWLLALVLYFLSLLVLVFSFFSSVYLIFSLIRQNLYCVFSDTSSRSFPTHLFLYLPKMALRNLFSCCSCYPTPDTMGRILVALSCALLCSWWPCCDLFLVLHFSYAFHFYFLFFTYCRVQRDAGVILFLYIFRLCGARGNGSDILVIYLFFLHSITKARLHRKQLPRQAGILELLLN